MNAGKKYTMRGVYKYAINYFMPEAGSYDAIDSKHLRSIIATTVWLILITLFYIPYCVLLNLPVMGMGVAAVPPVGIIALIVIRQFGKVQIAGHLVAFAILMALIIIHFASGLGSKPSIFWLAFYPIFCVVVVGAKRAYIWSFVAVVAVVVAEFWGKSTGYSYTEYNAETLFISIPVSLSIGIPFIAYFTGYAVRIKDQSLEEKDMLISAMSHDLANPIAGLMFAVDNVKLSKELKNDAMFEESIQHIDEISNRIHETIDIMKSFRSRGAFKLDLISWIDIEEKLNGKFDAFLKEKDIKLVYDKHEYKGIHFFGNAKILADHVLQNLIENAIKFSYSGSSVFVKVITDADYTVIDVRDEGVGIKYIDKVMSGQITTNGTNGELGTGLGVQAALQHIRKLKGSLQITSSHGAGSTFTIKFKNWSK